MLGAVGVHADQREAEPGRGVLAGQHLGLGDPEVLGAGDPALDLDEHEVAVAGAGADVVAGVVVRHLAAGRGRARARRPAPRRRRGGRSASCPARAAPDRRFGRAACPAGPAGCTSAPPATTGGRAVRSSSRARSASRRSSRPSRSRARRNAVSGLIFSCLPGGLGLQQLGVPGVPVVDLLGEPLLRPAGGSGRLSPTTCSCVAASRAGMPCSTAQSTAGCSTPARSHGSRSRYAAAARSASSRGLVVQVPRLPRRGSARCRALDLDEVEPLGDRAGRVVAVGDLLGDRDQQPRLLAGIVPVDQHACRA